MRHRSLWRWRTTIALTAGVLFGPSPAIAETFYVTQSGPGDGSSHDSALSIEAFNEGALGDLDGDTVFFSGLFSSTLVPPVSGALGSPVTLDGDDGVHEPATIIKGDLRETGDGSRFLCLHIYDRSHLIIRDFRFEGGFDESSSAWAYIDECDNILFEDLIATRHGRSWTQWWIRNSEYLTHRRCSWDGRDQLADYECDGIDIYNVHHSSWLECYFGTFPHNAFEAMGLSSDDFNVIRGCTFENRWRTGLNASFYTQNAWWLVEDNVFVNNGREPHLNPCVTYYSIDSGGPGFQTGSPYHIIRRNLFIHNNTGISIGWAHDIQHDCSIYQNTFYDSGRIAEASDWTDGHIFGTPYAHDWVQNVIMNNIFAESRVRQVAIDRDGEITFESIRAGVPGINTNLFWDSSQEEIKAQYRTGAFSQANSSQWIVASQGEPFLEAEYPDQWENNVVADPLFVDAEHDDFSIGEDSPAVDGGRFLTVISSSDDDAASSFTVADPLFFFDGWDIPDEQGDSIRTASGAVTTIVDVDYENNTLQVDPAITVHEGEGISLEYFGAAPDIGAFEYGDSPQPTCQNQGYSCCGSCDSGPHSDYDDDCPGQVCCEVCTPTDQECPEGRGDCNDDESDGCETDLTSDPDHCGHCGNVCEEGSCVLGRCESAGDNGCGGCAAVSDRSKVPAVVLLVGVLGLGLTMLRRGGAWGSRRP